MRLFFRKLLDFGRSLFFSDEVSQQRNLWMDPLMARVSSNEASIVRITDDLRRHKDDVTVGQKETLNLLTIIQEQCDLRFTTCNVKLVELEKFCTKNKEATQVARSETNSLGVQVADLRGSVETLKDKLSLTEAMLSQQEELLDGKTNSTREEMKNLIEMVECVRGQLLEHIERGNQYVSNLDKCLGKYDKDLKVSREVQAEQQDQINRLHHIFTEANLADAEDKISQAQIALHVQELQEAVQKNKQQLDALFESQSPPNPASAVEDVSEVREKLAKVTERVEKLEVLIKTSLAKLSNYIEWKSGAANSEDQSKRGQDEAVANMKKEIEELRREKNELAKEVKQLRHARKIDRVSDASLENRLGRLEEAAIVTAEDMEVVKNALLVLTSAAEDGENENAMLQSAIDKHHQSNDKKLQVVLDLIEPIVDNFVVEKNNPQSLNSKLAEITRQWESELENTVDEEIEMQKMICKAARRKRQNAKNDMESAVLAHFGDELRLNLPSLNDSADAPQINVTRRVSSSKVVIESGGAYSKCADRKHRDHYAAPAVVASGETGRQQHRSPDYIKMNITNVGADTQSRANRARESHSSWPAAN